MRGFLTLAVVIILAATVALGASSIGLRGLPGVVFFYDRIDVQAEALNVAFGADNVDMGPTIQPFSDTMVRLPGLAHPEGTFGYQTVDPDTGADLADEFLPIALGYCSAFMNGGAGLTGSAAKGFPSILSGKPVDPVTFGFQPAVFRSGGGGGSNVPVATATPPLFTPVPPPTGGPEITPTDPQLTQIAPIPLPSALLLIATALAGFGMIRRQTRLAG